LEYAGRITVEDTKGCRFQVHEFRGWRLLGHARRFMLENGARVRRIDFDNYVVAATGETLVRLDESHAAPENFRKSRKKNGPAQQGLKAQPSFFLD
jgi:hypothetical protein